LVLLVATHSALARGGDVPDYDFDWVTIGDPGNAAYQSPSPGGSNDGRGSVEYVYRMSRTEVTSGQWMEFLNAVGATNGFGVPHSSGIVESVLKPGTFSLNPAIADAANVPVIGISWRAAAYYVNWLHNDKGSNPEDIRAGVYDVSTFGQNPDGTFTDQLTHDPDARFWIPTLDEWMKAAFYDPNRFGSGQRGWWNYCNSSDVAPIPGLPGVGETSRGLDDPNIDEWLIPLGSYPQTQSPWGLLDVSGGAAEWLEDFNPVHNPGPRDRLYSTSLSGPSGPFGFLSDRVNGFIGSAHPTTTSAGTGLRIASVPAPPITFALMLGAILAQRSARRKRTT
jgi:hypothetical protein